MRQLTSLSAQSRIDDELKVVGSQLYNMSALSLQRLLDTENIPVGIPLRNKLTELQVWRLLDEVENWQHGNIL